MEGRRDRYLDMAMCYIEIAKQCKDLPFNSFDRIRLKLQKNAISRNMSLYGLTNVWKHGRLSRNDYRLFGKLLMWTCAFWWFQSNSINFRSRKSYFSVRLWFIAISLYHLNAAVFYEVNLHIQIFYQINNLVFKKILHSWYPFKARF